MHNITDRLVTEKLVAAVQTVEKLIWALRIAIWSSTNRGELDEYLTWKSRPGARLLQRRGRSSSESETVKEKWMKEEKSLYSII